MQQMNSALASRVSNNIIHSVLFSRHLFISHVIAWEYPLAPVATDDVSAKTSRLIFFLIIFFFYHICFLNSINIKMEYDENQQKTQEGSSVAALEVVVYIYYTYYSTV